MPTNLHLMQLKWLKVENSYGSSGSLSSTRSFEKVAADKAQSIVFLSNKDDT